MVPWTYAECGSTEGAPMTVESENTDRDYPQMPAARGRIEPSPRRVRGYVGSDLVVDTTSALYVWEVPYYPAYYLPLRDVREELLKDEDHPQKVQFGRSRMYALTAGGRTQPSAVRVFDTGGDSPVAGTARFEWDSMDWFEEDEPIVGHPRNPYVRVDALRSHRQVHVELGGVVLADTSCPVMLFETGLPTRYYIDATDVVFDHLEPSAMQTLCPYKGVTSQYWSVRVNGELHADLAWAYDYPLPAVASITRMVAFYNEKLDITVDGVALPRPRTHFG